jgi:thiamine-monophosphate kinase
MSVERLATRLSACKCGSEKPLSRQAFPPPDRDFLLKRYLYPEPRLTLSSALASHASAAMDISDGLALDASRMCSASRAAAEIEVASVPLSPAANTALATSPEAMQAILSGGDDYEILTAIPPAEAPAFEAAAAQAGVRVTRIGAVKSGLHAPIFLNTEGVPFQLSSTGFEHFKI